MAKLALSRAMVEGFVRNVAGDASGAGMALRQDAINAVSRARLDLVLDHPFFGSLALRLKPAIAFDCEVLATDGRTLWVNPINFLELTHHQRKALIAHEVLHCANGHPWRQCERDAETWSEACDLAINGILKDSGFDLPEGMALPDSSQHNQAAEVLYSVLIKNKPPQGSQGDGDESGDGEGEQDQNGEDSGDSSGDGQGSGQQQRKYKDPGAIRQPQESNSQSNGNGSQDGGQRQSQQNYGGMSPSEIERLDNEWKLATIQAALAAKSRGDLPGDLAQLVEQIKKPRIDWRAELRRFVQQHAKNDYSWSRPNTRYLARRLYLPALHSEEVGPIVIAVDTSGSISNAELEQFMGEIQSIVDEIKPESTLVIEADAAVNGVTKYDSCEPFSMPVIHGRGGTDFRPAFIYLDGQIEAGELSRPACMIYLTDLYGPLPEAAPDFPVLWVCTNEQQAAWGETLRLDVHEG